MNEPTRQRLFGVRHAFDSPVVVGVTIGVIAILIIAPLIVVALRKLGRIDDKHYAELRARILSWMIITPLLAIPLLLGAASFIAFVGILSLLCYREFARATGLFRHRTVSAIVVLGILAVTFANLDNWQGLFAALPPLLITILAAAAVLEDQPKGYIQRVALGVFALLFIGVGLGHLGHIGNDANYRAIVAWLLVCVEFNDVFAYVSGKAFGQLRLAPNTSPNKTIGGAVGALVLTTTVAALLGHFVFLNSRIDTPRHLIALGLIISIGGQFGDLMLSSLKRDLGIKDMSNLIPGHGGLLDRFDSLLLVAPAVFHYLRYFIGIAVGQQERIISG